MATAGKTHSHGAFSVTISPKGAITVKSGDSISAYCSAIHHIDPEKTKKYWSDFGRIKGATVIALSDPNSITVGETIYHIPTYNSAKKAVPKIKSPPVMKLAVKPTETLIDYDTDIRGGTIGIAGVNDAYDLYLYKISTGNLRLEVSMKIQFYFKDSGTNVWTPAQKTTFVKNWKSEIKKIWCNRVIKILPSGKKVHLDLDFDTQIGGRMLDHWEITVTRIPKGDFMRSSVNPLLGNVSLDSEDLTNVPKGCAGQLQTGAAHEFGHMLGLADEYITGSKHIIDCASIMHSGSSTRPRHDSTMIKWLDKTLKEHGIH